LVKAMNFEFATAGKITFGVGVFRQIGNLASSFGTHALVTSGYAQGEHLVEEALVEAGVEFVVYPVFGEPTVESIQAGADLARDQGCDLTIGFGGGSAIDSAKAIAALTSNIGNLLDYLEVIGKGRSLTSPPLPCIAIPTTAGTGSEVTRNAVIGSREDRVKVSLRSALMLPRVALVDPELTYDLPPDVTASTGSDALTQLIEPFLSPQANPLTDALCREGIPWAARSLRQAFNHPHDYAAREDMSLSSLFGGLALANSKLGAVHGFAGPIGGTCPAPHGTICARLLPIVFETNLAAMRKRASANPILERFDETARLLTGDARASAETGVEWLYGLREELKIPHLADFELKETMLDELVEQAERASSMKGNPVLLTRAELYGILEKAL
jgi:alcohol dehydrogenase class IV